MKHLKKFNESQNEDIEDIKSIFKSLVVDYLDITEITGDEMELARSQRFKNKKLSCCYSIINSNRLSRFSPRSKEISDFLSIRILGSYKDSEITYTQVDAFISKVRDIFANEITCNSFRDPKFWYQSRPVGGPESDHASNDCFTIDISIEFN